MPGLSLGLECQAVPRILAVPNSSHGTQIPLLGLGWKSLGQSRDCELWDSSPWDKNSWDWQSRPVLIPDIKAGAPVAYYDNSGQICEGSFLCTGKQFEEMNPIDIIAEVLNSDEEIRKFCKDNNIGDLDDHIFKWVVF